MEQVTEREVRRRLQRVGLALRKDRRRLGVGYGFPEVGYRVIDPNRKPDRRGREHFDLTLEDAAQIH
jgi:hypothetical protein